VFGCGEVMDDNVRWVYVMAFDKSKRDDIKYWTLGEYWEWLSR